MALMTDAEAKRVAERETIKGEIYGTPIPTDEWVGRGALDEFKDGKGADDDDK